MSRVAAIRRLLEEGEQADLFAPNVVHKKPWDLAAVREAKADKRPANTRFSPKTRFGDLKVTVVDAFDQNDTVVVRWRLRGTWNTPFMGLQPSGRAVDITGVNYYHFVGDKIVATDGDFDAPSFMLQARGSISAEDCEEAMVEFSRPPDAEIAPIRTVQTTQVP
jgi:hypothetical protein